jgi:ABC-type sugar transport system substrate-binding protein
LKKILALIITATMALGLAGCGGSSNTSSNGTSSDSKKAKSHIGIVTGTVAQSEDELRGAEAFIKEYGDVDKGGIVKHVTYPDNFMQEQETTIAQIAGLADDPDMKAIIVNQSVPGTVAAFKKIRERRPDILLFAGEPQEDTNMVEAASDLVINADNVNRGYLMILAAKKMGAKTFVHISFPRHMSIELLSLRKTIMEQACKDLGLKFAFETAPDPMSDVGIPGAQQFILEKMPSWVQKYGKDTAFFCTNDAQTEPLLKKVAELGAIFVEPDLPSPIMGYPGAFGIDLKAEAGNWPAILKKVEQTVISKGGSGRMGTWAYSYNYASTEALAEFAKRVIEGKAQKDSFKDLMACYEKSTPGASWNGSYYIDRATGTEKKNHIMLYQDTYVFGKGYLGQTKEVVPDKYKNIK